MNCEYELDLLFSILKKCHVHAAVISLQDGIEAIPDPSFWDIIKPKTSATVGDLLGQVDGNTKYAFISELALQYTFVRLPVASAKNILAIGPYLSAHVPPENILEISEKTGAPLGALRALKEYYSLLPIIPESDNLHVMINVFLERIWQTDSFAVAQLNKAYSPFLLQSDAAAWADSSDGAEANVKMMERRYALENELIRAVSQGQQNNKVFLMSMLDEQTFESRAATPLRNTKNYCIIMNTLLRKAAENGGVHPIYIDKVSSEFALRIELLPTPKACVEIMSEMVSAYCRLVYKHSVKGYSPTVKETVLIIETDISAELSLSTLAKRQGISAGHLSAVFKKETGKTVMEYIIEKRIEHARYLLSTTTLQIQTVALHCGIVDVQHFSKLFKKKTGKTPTEYRKAANRR